MASSVFASNLFFARQGDYFAGPSELMPMLHTWSLSVEEQFYMVFPVLLLLLSTRVQRSTLKLVLVLLFSISLVACIVVSYQGSTKGFYLSHYRIWELLLGALIAIGAVPTFKSRVVAEIGTLAGLASILAALCLFTRELRYPGAYALVPCLGASLIIMAGQHRTIVSRILAWRPCVAIGLISYSLYLWHWPVIVFLKYWHVTPLSSNLVLAAVALSIVLAVASWTFVEQPFRKRGPTLPVHAVTTGLSGLAVLAGMSGLVIVSSGWPWRLTPESRAILPTMNKYSYFELYDRRRCFLDGDQGVSDYNKEFCLRKIGTQRILVWGDSFAAHLVPGLRKLRKELDSEVAQYTATSCRPLRMDNRRCDDFNQRFGDAVRKFEPDTVILAGHWLQFVDSGGSDELEARLQETLKRFAKSAKRVVLIGQTPSFEFMVSMILFQRTAARSIKEHYFPARDAEPINSRLMRLAHKHGVTFIDPYKVLCRHSNDCLAIKDGRVLCWDHGHMTAAGSDLLAAHLLLKLNAFGSQ